MSAAQCLDHAWLGTSLARRQRERDVIDAPLMARLQWRASVAMVSAANWLYKTIVPPPSSSTAATTASYCSSSDAGNRATTSSAE